MDRSCVDDVVALRFTHLSSGKGKCRHDDTKHPVLTLQSINSTFDFEYGFKITQLLYNEYRIEIIKKYLFLQTTSNCISISILERG